MIRARITRKYYGPADISVKECGTTPIFLHKTIFLNGQCVYCVRLQMGNKKMNPFKNKNIRIKFYLFCRTHAFEHHQYIVEFYITKLLVQCSLPMCDNRVLNGSLDVIAAIRTMAIKVC